MPNGIPERVAALEARMDTAESRLDAIKAALVAWFLSPLWWWHRDYRDGHWNDALATTARENIETKLTDL